MTAEPLNVVNGWTILVHPLFVAQLREFIAADIVRWRKVVTEGGIRLE